MRSGVGTRVVPFILNEQFLRAIFGDRWIEALVSYFAGDPQTRPDWRSYPAGTVLKVMGPDLNNYYDVSLPRPGGGRGGGDFGELYVIVLDDYGVKVDKDKVEQLLGLPPSYVIETSPGNYHAGWLVEPLSDRAWVVGLLRSLYRALGAGDNLVKPTTLVRLPVGTNGKVSLGLGPGGWKVRLIEWRPGTRIKHSDWVDIEARIGSVTPVDLRIGVGGGSMPDPAEIEDDAILGVLRGRGMVRDQGRMMTFGWGFEIECPWSSEHLDPRTAASYVPVKERFKCHHGHCENRTMADLRVWADGVVREDSGGLVTLAALEFDDIDIAFAGAEGGPGSWKSLWLRGGANGAGKPDSNLHNVQVALQLAPELAGAFGLNEFTLREMLLRELPGVMPGTTQGVPREWRAPDTIRLQKWLQHEGLHRITPGMIDDAVSVMMQASSFHPVRDWLAGLSWDQAPRLDTWMSRYFGTPQDPYHAYVGRWWLMTMCRRVFEPGCRADYMPVLEGAQGVEKSTAMRTLAGDQWFSDKLPDLNSKDASEHLVGRWLIEIAEMDRFDRTESAVMKAFITRTTERYRRPYARRSEDEPRQCMFAGTVNHRSYLKDETGNRRIWPVAVGSIDLAGLALARDQLFAEAWWRAVTNNEPYWPEPVFEDLFMRPEQEARLEADPWEPLVVSFLRDQTRVLVHDVIVAVTGGGSYQLNTTNRNRVTRIMETLRWKRGARGPNGERFWYKG